MAEVVTRLRNGESNIADHFDDATVIFADVVGFGKITARMKAYEIVACLNELFSEFDKLAEEAGIEMRNRDSPDELGSGANCSDFLDCLELPTRDKGDFRHSRLLHGVRGSVWPFCVAFGRTPPVGCR